MNRVVTSLMLGSGWLDAAHSVNLTDKTMRIQRTSEKVKAYSFHKGGGGDLGVYSKKTLKLSPT